MRRPMRRVVLALLAPIGVVLAVGCSSGPRDKVAEHLDEMVSLLEQHKESVDGAADALEAYVQEHAAELSALRAELAKKKQELAERTDEMADYAGDFLVRIGPTMERAHRLMLEYPELGRSERLQKVLQSIGTQ